MFSPRPPFLFKRKALKSWKLTFSYTHGFPQKCNFLWINHASRISIKRKNAIAIYDSILVWVVEFYLRATVNKNPNAHARTPTLISVRKIIIKFNKYKKNIYENSKCKCRKICRARRRSVR